jgi:tRNA/rRNA methyltransferase
VIVAYEWFKLTSDAELPFGMPQKSDAAPRQQLLAFFANLERELERVEFFRPPDKRATMQINLRNIFARMAPTQQDIQTLSGVIMAIAEGRKGPARGGVLDGEEAGALRQLLAEHDGGRVPGERGPVRGLARLLRRNPTDGERALWEALTKDRRFAGLFKRQTPVGPHINDFVSFQRRLVIDVVPEAESQRAAQARAERHDWLKQRAYRVVEIQQADLQRDVAGVLDSLAAALSGPL